MDRVVITMMTPAISMKATGRRACLMAAARKLIEMAINTKESSCMVVSLDRGPTPSPRGTDTKDPSTLIKVMERDE